MKINNNKELQQAIYELEWRKDFKEKKIIENVKEIYTNFQPRNILKNFLHTLVTSSSLQSKLFNTSLGIGSGIITNKLISNKSSSVAKKIAGRVIQAGITGIVAKNAYKVKAIGSAIIKNVFKKNAN